MTTVDESAEFATWWATQNMPSAEALRLASWNGWIARSKAGEKNAGEQVSRQEIAEVIAEAERVEPVSPAPSAPRDYISAFLKSMGPEALLMLRNELAASGGPPVCDECGAQYGHLLNCTKQSKSQLKRQVAQSAAAPVQHALSYLRNVVDFGGYDGFGVDQYHAQIADLLEGLDTALKSQIEITNNERLAKESCERRLREAEKELEFFKLFEPSEKHWKDRALAAEREIKMSHDDLAFTIKERDSFKKDAERYRWLVTRTTYYDKKVLNGAFVQDVRRWYHDTSDRDHNTLQEHIDAARQQEEKP